MNTAPHEFVTVDMRGLKAALVARAREQRVSVSAVVRDAVAHAMPSALVVASGEGVRSAVDSASSRGAVKLSIRLTPAEVRRLDAGAEAAGLSRAAFLSGLLDGINVLSAGGRQDHLAALVSASAELSTLSRNVRHLAVLLGRSEWRAAQAYRSMLDTIADDVEKHLRVAGDVLIQMRPSSRGMKANGSSQRHKEKD
jgi:hypothetical protein